ncbi:MULTISPECIES: hypothetical protein [Bacillus cereus group]|uniref:hypothetical protein n=1 Tax=Bacillus cereus group TaxID=86661 RepID=UPI0007B6CEB8|nr:hypothetical protein [Bacillus cereus]ANC07802.1 hypothetical protein WR47_12090 [Bacillus cereus]ANC13624.1 hypothetical protein WR51_12100 [Bacillus cereus]MDA1995279.1 hypothetical protein [Bacillus cereus]MDA2001313.1 hypothetical protein [Bacillus cereus]MDA3655089.1 hypothetical protein [Bacillus cereus]
MTQSESQFMLHDAKKLLEEIEYSYKNYLNEESIPRELRNKIRYFLNNIESALDYQAFDIFSRYCAKNVKPEKLEQHKKRVNFPLYSGKDWFNKKIDDTYPGLRTECPHIISAFEKCQPFPSGSSWLSRFNLLVNNNKHRNLTKQERKQTTHIGYMEDIFGNKIINCTFEGIGQPIVYGNTPVNFSNDKPHPYVKHLNATTYVDFVFKDIDKSVLPTLEEIHTGASSVINELEQNI